MLKQDNMDDCIFCKIANKEIPAEIFYEDEHTIAFIDIRPVSKGHSLVIPKKHFIDLLATDTDVLAAMMETVKKVGQGVMAATGATGFNLGVNTKAAAGQVVFHTHFHIIPRYAHDGLKMWPHSEAEPKTRAQMAEEFKKFVS